MSHSACTKQANVNTEESDTSACSTAVQNDTTSETTLTPDGLSQINATMEVSQDTGVSSQSNLVHMISCSQIPK